MARAYCTACGADVPVGSDGFCHVGHRVDPSAVAPPPGPPTITPGDHADDAVDEPEPFTFDVDSGPAPPAMPPPAPPVTAIPDLGHDLGHDLGDDLEALGTDLDVDLDVELPTAPAATGFDLADLEALGTAPLPAGASVADLPDLDDLADNLGDLADDLADDFSDDFGDFGDLGLLDDAAPAAPAPAPATSPPPPLPTLDAAPVAAADATELGAVSAQLAGFDDGEDDSDAISDLFDDDGEGSVTAPPPSAGAPTPRPPAPGAPPAPSADAPTPTPPALEPAPVIDAGNFTAKGAGGGKKKSGGLFGFGKR